MQNPPPNSASASTDRRLPALVTYLLFWIGGLIGLFGFGKNDPDLRYHGAQSLVLFGGLTVINIVLTILGGLFLAGLFSLLNWLVDVVSLIAWIYCMYKAWTGNGARFEVPVLGSLIAPYVEQVAGAAA
jgi:uncharacterized membrane protein